MSDLRYTPDAELAIEEVAEYSLELYGAKGEAYVQGLQIVIERLRLLPRMGLVVPGRKDGMLRVRHGRHLVFYCVEENGDVLVVDVLHEKMSPSHLR